MKIKLITLGSEIPNEFKIIEDQYIKRVKRYIDFEMICLKDPGKRLKLSAEELKNKEGKLITSVIKISDKVILLDEKGRNWGSIDFARSFLQKEMDANVKNLVFVIGGPFGFSDEIRKRSNGLISLSKMTFTHEMTRMIFLEQLYRGLSILKGEKYHHE